MSTAQDADREAARNAEAEALCAQIIAKLAGRSQTLATCESLTAGLCAATIAGVPGASAVLKGGLITYATELKVQIAQMPQRVVDEYGVISAECATYLARGARERCAADWGVGLTGVAGPDSQDGKPAGTVFVAVAGPQGVEVKKLGGEAGLSGSRNEIRRQSVVGALELLNGLISS